MFIDEVLFDEAYHIPARKDRRDNEPAQQHRPTTPWWRVLLAKGKSDTQHFAHRKAVKLASSVSYFLEKKLFELV